MQNHRCQLNIINRRSFLGGTLKAGLLAAFGSLTNIPLIMKKALAEGTIGQPGPDGKIRKVLFIWLRGANDGLNSVIPAGDSAYGPGIRPTLAIPTGSAWQNTSGGAQFVESGAGPTFGTTALGLGNGFAALHPSLKFLAPVYNAGHLALIHRVGYPRQSRSHFDSQRYWENGSPNRNLINDGIFYRALLESGLAQTAPLTGVSIQSSLPLILRGSEAAMTNLTDPIRYDLLGLPNNAAGNLKATNALNQANIYPFPPKYSRDMLKLQYQNMANTLQIFGGIGFAESGNTFRDDETTDGDSTWAAANGNQGYYLFPTTNDKNGGWRRPGGTTDATKYVVPPGLQGLFEDIKAAALILNNTDAIIAGTESGGFDTHNNQGQLTGTHPDLNRGFGWAMYALRKYFTNYANKATWDNVLVVTLTEFGRTTIENGTVGTDHAEGGVMFVAGGLVKGYDGGSRSGVFNCGGPTDPVPWLTGNNGAMFDAGRQRADQPGRYLSRATDYRQVLGEIIREHLGATQNQLNRIIPGYANESTEHLLGGGASTDGFQIRGELDIV